jgi:hypothetical protein
MMTKTLMACLAATLFILTQPARAAGEHGVTASHTTSFEHGHRGAAPRPPAPIARPDVTGVIARAIRGGHPLQMLNPRAPAQYGTAEENVVLDPDVPGQGNGIKLISIPF